MKAKYKRILSAILSITMLMSSILCVDLSSFANDINIENRAEWLSKLVETFDMTVESDNYPDNYFSDLTEESEYYRDVLVATEYGLISVEAGDPIYPEDELTREFAAQTLNACLNFQLEENEDGEYSYTFDDVEDCSFPYDDQIAVNRQWFELVDNNFCPNDVVKSTEITAMLDDANAQIEITTVDENYDSTIEVANGVVEIPNGTELTIDENNTITVIDCPVSIKKGDNFTAYFYDLPNAYVAQSVTVDGNKTIIATQEANAEEVFENVDIQEVSQIDDSEFIPAEGITVEPDVQPVSTFSRSRASTPVNALNNVKIGGDLTVDGWKIALSAKISNPVLETNITTNKTYVALKTDIDLSYSVSTKTSNKLNQTNKTSKVIPVGYINILGVGFFKVSFEISLSGGITIKEKFNITMGESYAEGEDLRIIADFTHKDFSIAVEATLKAGYKFELGISIAIVKADVYASVGFAVKGTLTGYPSGTPSTCLNITGYMYLDIGAELTINLFFTSLHFGVEKAIIDEKNSPVKFAFHFEDGKKVHECTRGKTPKYLTPSDSKHSNSADDCVNNYENVDSSSFNYSVSNGNATITGYTSSSSIVVIPEYIDGYKVTSIGYEAFYNCTSLTSVTIPDTVTSIGYRAFYGCTSLTSVIIPNSVTSISVSAFSGCWSLTSVTIGNSVTSIGDWAFRNCTSLTSVTIPNSVTSIGEAAFFLCENLTSVTIPDSVTSIGDGAFSDCTSLTSVTIPDSVTKIGNRAFSDCTSLKSVTIGNSVTSIGGNAFEYCESLTSVTIGNSVTSIGGRAFYDCTSLTNVTIPNSVTSIGGNAFKHCKSLTSLTIPDSVTSIGDSAFYCVNNIVYNGTATGSPWGAKAVNGYVDGYLVYKDSTKQELLGCSAQAISVTIPNSVKSIGNQAFGYCTNLTNITIPNSVTKIGWNAFGSCKSLTNVVIPSSVTSIDSEIFGACVKLKSVTIPKSIKEIGTAVFYSCTSLTDIYYNGSISDWNSIKITEAGNESLKKATIHCSNGVINCQHKSTKTTTAKATTSKDGKIVKTCTVCGKTVSTTVIEKASSIKLSTTTYTYDGKAKTPSVTVKDSKGKTISSSNYTVNYAGGRKNVGKYAVKITFKGNYSGTKTLYFTIKPKATSISSVSAGSKKFTVKWKKQSTQVTGYQIQYSTSSKFTSPKYVTVSSYKTTSKTISKLKGKKKYYVRIRTYKTVNGTKHFSSWSVAKSVTSKK